MADDSGGDEPQLRSATAARRRLLLMLGVAELQHASRKLSPVMHWLIGLALAMAGSTLVERLQFLDGFEDAVLREVARQRTLANELSIPGANELQVQQLEISAQARVATLEQRTSVDGVIERLGGVAPIQRGRMADVIKALAAQMPDAGPATAPIFAIDIDLAPLEGGATTGGERDQMLDALTTLRKKAHVIAVVLPRAAGTAGGREERNCFMRQAQCTRVTGATASGDSHCSLPSTDVTATTHNALFFASPRLFQPTGSYPTKYPYKLKEGDRMEGRAGEETPPPPYYPSLGTLIHQQFKHRFSHGLAPTRATDKEEAKLASAKRQTLTALCEQAHAPRPDGELLEDRMATPAAEGIAKAYDDQRYSWRLLDDPRLQHTVIERVDLHDWTSSLDKTALARPVLLLGIDGGASYDKFGIAGISAQPVSGAGLHALQALSIEWQPSPLKQKFAGILVDFGLGLAYSLAWLLLYKPVLLPLRARMPVIGGWLIAGVPLALGVFFTWVCFKVVAIGMGIDLWINPIYIVAGLLLGIYADAWSDSEAGTEEERKLRHRLLGLPAARDALRSGFGQRLDGVRFAATSGYQPVTGMDELRVHAEVVRSRLGTAALTDAVLSAVLRLVVLFAGWGFIFYELYKVWRP